MKVFKQLVFGGTESGQIIRFDLLDQLKQNEFKQVQFASDNSGSRTKFERVFYLYSPLETDNQLVLFGRYESRQKGKKRKLLNGKVEQKMNVFRYNIKSGTMTNAIDVEGKNLEIGRYFTFCSNTKFIVLYEHARKRFMVISVNSVQAIDFEIPYCRISELAIVLNSETTSDLEMIMSLESISPDPHGNRRKKVKLLCLQSGSSFIMDSIFAHKNEILLEKECTVCTRAFSGYILGKRYLNTDTTFIVEIKVIYHEQK